MASHDDRNLARAQRILADVDGHLLADLRSMKMVAVQTPGPGVGLGRLNFALMIVSLVGCEQLGVLVSGASRHHKGVDPRRVDSGGYITDFITGYFPAKHPFKRIAKILADSARHELVHGFGLRASTSPFQLGLYVSADPNRLFEVRRQRQREILAINSVAFAATLLASVDALRRTLDRKPTIVHKIIAGSRIKLEIQTGVANEFEAIRERFAAKLPSNPRIEPTRAGS